MHVNKSALNMWQHLCKQYFKSLLKWPSLFFHFFTHSMKASKQSNFILNVQLIVSKDSQSGEAVAPARFNCLRWCFGYLLSLIQRVGRGCCHTSMGNLDDWKKSGHNWKTNWGQGENCMLSLEGRRSTTKLIWKNMISNNLFLSDHWHMPACVIESLKKNHFYQLWILETKTMTQSFCSYPSSFSKKGISAYRYVRNTFFTLPLSFVFF